MGEVLPLSLLSWNDKKRSRVILTGLLTAGVAIASAAVSVAAAPLPAGPPSAPTPVIVRGSPGTLATVDQEIARAGGRVTEQIPLITASAAEVPSGALDWLSEQPGIVEVTPDGPVQLTSSSYSPTTNAGSLYSVEQSLGVDQAWQDGYTGSGIGVALIDTGVNPVVGLDASGQIINGADLSFDNSSSSLRYLDANGHGTFMAGIIAGRDPGATSGKYAGDTTDFLGIAPDSHIVNVKVGSANGAVDVSQVLAAIDWVVMHRYDEGFNIRVLNLSFGTDSSQSYLLDPLAFAAEAAWREGIVVVAAVGNQGSGSTRLADPAIDPYLIAVGASQGSGSTLAVAPFSSAGTSSRSPDVIAPGTSIVSLRDPGSVIDDEYGATAEVGSRFFLGTGTSQATAVTSGLAALLVQEHPSATPDQIKGLLTSTATPVAGASSLVTGHGQVSASAAVQAALPSTVQSFTASTGTGTLQGARGSLQVTLGGVALSGEQDIFDDAVNTASLATVEGYADSWSGGSWNGAVWSGSYWVWSPTLMDWDYVAWTGNSWTGVAWSTVMTSSGSWNGTSWSGTSWSGTSWSGTSWSGVSWSGTSWSKDGWSSYKW
ncbi:MAG: S8 family serine peptidase [Candidatus Dormibacteria bacterium]